MKKPKGPPSLRELFEKYKDSLPDILSREIRPTHGGRYYHWDTLRHIAPPSGLESEMWWFAIKIARNASIRQIPLLDKNAAPFKYASPDPLWKMLHEIDRDASGQIGSSDQITNPATRDRYIINSLIEEAITSSQLEGASTTVDVAKKMIRTGRRPVDRSERMILNNYQAMRHIRDRTNEKLTPDLILALHHILTSDTLEKPDAVGRLRHSDEDVYVSDSYGTRLHEPPAADELQTRMAALCSFANTRSNSEFMHPVVRAIIVHFWLAHDHPFVDGNGRTARALFYWSMLSQGYWLFEFLSISHILKQGPARYGKAFLYTETDANDLTYFILFQLRVIRRAIIQLHEYLERKIEEIKEAERLIRATRHLNHRQVALLGDAIRDPNAVYTIESHRSSHDVVYQTARTDMQGLVEKGLLSQSKRGRVFVYVPGPELEQLRESA